MLQISDDITTQIFCKSSRSGPVRGGEESVGFGRWNLELELSRIMKKRGNWGCFWGGEGLGLKLGLVGFVLALFGFELALNWLCLGLVGFVLALFLKPPPRRIFP